MSGTRFGASPQGGALSTSFNAIVTGMNTLGSIWIFALMVMIDADAFGRTFFTHPIHGVNELVELSLIGIVFLQLGDATRRGRLTRSDGFFKFALGRAPRVGRLMGAVFDFLGVLFMVIILFGAVPDLVEAWEKNFFVGQEGLFTAPEWPIKAVIVIGCLVTLLQFLVFGWRYLIPGGAPPVEHVSRVD
jgi:TRAP-type mannitol/chloroaromatic compound transport system permease small subunit